jgi:hypothetical protein
MLKLGDLDQLRFRRDVIRHRPRLHFKDEWLSSTLAIRHDDGLVAFENTAPVAHWGRESLGRSYELKDSSAKTAYQLKYRDVTASLAVVGRSSLARPPVS